MGTAVLFLDDASRPAGTIDRNGAEARARTLLDTLRRLRKSNKRFALNTPVPIAHYQLAENWTLQAIFGGNEFREEWDFIRQLSSRSPLDAEMEKGLVEEMACLEFRTRQGKVQSIALAWAYLLESATVGLDAHADWGQPWVETEFSVLEEDGAVSSEEGQVRNASREQHVDVHEEWLKVLGFSSHPSAAQVWGERGERFPGLRFLARAEKDLLSLEGTGVPYRQALSAIQALANDVANWKPEQAWPDFSTKATPESEQRRKYCNAHDELTGKKECFEWHTRFTGGVAGRVHFRVDEAARQIVVAYIGPKLFKDMPG